MYKIKAKLVGTGMEDDPFTVRLPMFKMQGDADYQKMECYVLVPDDETEEKKGKTKLNQQRIREKYVGKWSKFNASSVEIIE